MVCPKSRFARICLVGAIELNSPLGCGHRSLKNNKLPLVVAKSPVFVGPSLRNYSAVLDGRGGGDLLGCSWQMSCPLPIPLERVSYWSHLPTAYLLGEFE